MSDADDYGYCLAYARIHIVKSWSIALQSGRERGGRGEEFKGENEGGRCGLMTKAPPGIFSSGPNLRRSLAADRFG